MNPIQENASLGDGGEDINVRVENALVSLTWRSYSLAAIAEPPVALALVLMIQDQADQAHLLGWAAYALLLYSTRGLLAFRWWQSEPSHRDRNVWARILHGHSFASALIWGGASVLFIPALPPLQQAFLIAIICGISGGAMAELSSYRPALLTNVPALLGPMGLTFFAIGGETYLALGILCLVYIAYLLKVGVNHEKSIRQSHAHQFEREAIVKRLEASKMAAERANKAKGDFLANMSHELRTPLNAIIGFSEIIETRALGDKDIDRYTEYAGHIRSSGEHLLVLVNGILDLSKADASSIELNQEALDLVDLCRSSVIMLEPVARKSGVVLTAERLDGIVCPIVGDPVRLRQIVLNILSNAIKFTPEAGRVSLEIHPHAEGRCDLKVCDTGVGMSAEQVEEALQPFVQLDQGYGKKYQGSGLGLPITKMLVEKHGGSLKIESEPGRGTDVTVTLPSQCGQAFAQVA